MSEHRPKGHLTKRGKLFIGGLAATATLSSGIAMNGGVDIKWDQEHSLSQAQLDQLPKKTITVDPGESPIEVVQSVESHLATADAQGFHDVTDYVRSQGLITDGGHKMLKQFQNVQVPIVSGMENPGSK